MKTILVILSLFCASIALAEGTHTFSQVKQADISKSYLDISKIVVTKEMITVADREEEKICFTIDNKYKITDTKELILLLLEIVTDMKSKNP